MVEILDLDLRAGAGWYKLRHVALLAGQGLMLSFQGQARFSRMIEGLTVQSNQSELFAVVVRVASRAVRLAGGTLVLAGMITRVGVQSVLDLNVTLEALKAPVPCPRSKIVTRCALSHALVLLVSA
jgi:hypothetical protein